MSRVEYVAVQCGLLGAVLVEDTDHLDRALRNTGTGAEDGCDTCLVES